MSGQHLSPEEARKLGEQRESWCAVEMKKEQSWMRATRKHFEEQFTSKVFEDKTLGYEPRCTFTVDAPTHRERRHYSQQFQSQINI
ncbi:hypothetical protein ACJMK2_037436 [Sinanodonta woodiana]|uniref:Uncharacterized protein n=1 Tax=Sinanodonta woodiana TaxID=1069815 RepID=A0ABD3WNU9_SINWO